MGRTLHFTGKVELVQPYMIRTASSGRQVFSFQHFPNITADAYLFARVRAVTADVPNKNGDCFPYDELRQSYHSFIGRPVCCDHKSSNVDDVYGLILDATWVENGDHGAWVELLLAVDRSHDALCRKIESGQVTDVSMGCLVKEGICSVCGNICRGSTDEYGQVSDMCEHIRYYKGSIFDGQEVFENCKGVEFIEISWVTDGADGDAIVLDINIKPETNLPEDVLLQLNSNRQSDQYAMKKVAAVQKISKQNDLVAHLDEKQGAILFEACKFASPDDYLNLFHSLQSYRVREAYQELLETAKDNARVVKALMYSDDSDRWDYVLSDEDAPLIKEFAYDGLSHINEVEDWAFADKLVNYVYGKLEEHFTGADSTFVQMFDPDHLINSVVEGVLNEFRTVAASVRKLRGATKVVDISILRPGVPVLVSDAEYGLSDAEGVVHAVAETEPLVNVVDWVQIFIEEPTVQVVVVYQDDVSNGVTQMQIL